jgi:hypothetical protein
MKYIYITAFLLLSIAVNAQDTLWHKGGIISLNFSQTSLTNWAAGGESSVAANGLVNVFAKYKLKRIAWDNSLDLGYGFIKSGELDLRKNEDKIDFTSKFGYAANDKNKLFYTALLNFKSQFTTGYEYPNDTTKVKISDFAAPAYTLFSLGMDYKPYDYFSLYISPLTIKTTIVSDQNLADAGAFGVDKASYDVAGNKIADGEKVRTEFGAYLNARFQKDVATNVNLLTKLDLFSNYSENPQNVDVNWELLLAMKVNSLLTASISTQLIYDDDIDIQEYAVRNGFRIPKVREDRVTPLAGPRVQFKEVISIGLSYKL